METAVATAERIVSYPYVEQKEGVCGGRPVIVGTRITVSLIAELYNNGHSVDEIIALYPHLNHAEVHDALSFYYDHKREIDKEIEENTEEFWQERVKGEIWQK